MRGNAIYSFPVVGFEVDGSLAGGTYTDQWCKAVLHRADVQNSRKKDLALLAYLAVTGSAHTRQHLAALLWPEDEPARAFANLRRSLYELNRLLGEGWLEVNRDTAALGCSPQAWLDVKDFQSLLGSSRDQRAQAGRLEDLEAAAHLYGGDFLEGFSIGDGENFEEWRFYQAAELRNGLAVALEALALLHAENGNYKKAISYANRWLALDNLHEPAYRLLMRLYAWSGDRGKAIRQYQQCARILEEELGVEPESATRQLYEQIQSSEVEAKRQLKEEGNVPSSNLPASPTPFIGRETELEQIQDYLENPDCRLLTLLGPGGIGKTRLALQAAGQAKEEFSQRVYFVPLAAIHSASAILAEIASSLNFQFHSGSDSTKDQIISYLRPKKLLLIFDNFEHLAEGAGLLEEICANTAGVKVLVTSRQRLNLQCEWVFEVSGLSYPEGKIPPAPKSSSMNLEEDIQGYSSVQLFLQSARRAGGADKLSEEDYPVILRIVQLVQGLPLALELASFWIPVLSSREIAAEIERNLDFLETSMRDIPDRLRSMRAVFDYSWNLLAGREKDIFCQLSVFRGGFTREAAADILAISPHEIRSLANKSLIQRGEDDRFDMHPLLRQYAAKKLAQDLQAQEDIGDRHSIYYHAAMKKWGEALKGNQRGRALEEIGADLEDALDAWNWAIERQEIVRITQAMECLCLFYWMQVRYNEGAVLCEQAARSLKGSATGIGRQMRARALTWQGVFHTFLSRFDLAEECFQESFALLDLSDIDAHLSQPDRALALWAKGELEYWRGKGEESTALLEKSLKMFEDLADHFWASEVLSTLGEANAYLLWDTWQGEKYWTRGLELKKALGDQFKVASILYHMAVVEAFHSGNQAKAEQLFLERNQVYQQIGDRASSARALECLAQIDYLNARFEQSLEKWQEQLAMHEEQGDRSMVAWSQLHIGGSYQSMGDYNQAGHMDGKRWRPGKLT